MELRFNGYSHLHYIRAIRYGEVVKVSNLSHGGPALKFKKVSDEYESEGVRRVRSMANLLPKEESSDPETGGGSEERQRDLESGWSSSGLSSFDFKDEIDDQMDDSALDGMTITQMREMFKSKKRKQQNHLDVSEKNGVILTIKKEEEEEDEDADEDELLEPLITLKTKVKDEFVGKGRGVKVNIKTPNDAEVVPSVLISCPQPASQSPSNDKSSIVVKIEDEPNLYPADIPCIVGDSDVHIDMMVPDPSEDIKKGVVDYHSDSDPCIVYTSLEMPSAVVTNCTCEGASECDSDREIYACKEAESCVINEVPHEKIGHDLFLDGNDADFAAVDHVENEEASTSSLLVTGNPTERMQTGHPTDTLKSCDESSQAADMKLSLQCSDLSSEMVSSATLRPSEGVSPDSVIQFVDEIRERLHLSHETIAVTASHGVSASSKLEQHIQKNEVQFMDSHDTTLCSNHEMSFMGVWRGRSSSGEHLPGITVFQDGKVRDEDRVKDNLHSTHEISNRCISSDSSLSQELQSEKQDFQINEAVVVDKNREKLLSSQQTNDTGIFREMASLSEHNEQDCRHYEPQFEDSSGESFRSSHKACATESAALSSSSAENPIVLASSGFCSPPYASIADRLSHVKVCKVEEINTSADAPSNAVIDATTSTELVNGHRDRRSQQTSGRLFCARKVISPKSQERLCKLLGSDELHDDKIYPRRKLIFQKLIEAENSGVPSAGVKRAELPSSPNQFRRKRKNQTRRLPPRDVFKTPPSSSVGTPSVNSMQRFAESAIAFSQRQMQDIDGLAATLMNELNVMKDIIEEYTCPGNKIAGAKTCTPDEMRDVIDNASRVKETTKKWLSIMARDCNRFCKIMRLSDGSSGSAISEKGSIKERKKIVFADEAGGDLCQVKYIEDMSSTSLVKDEAEE